MHIPEPRTEGAQQVLLLLLQRSLLALLHRSEDVDHLSVLAAECAQPLVLRRPLLGLPLELRFEVLNLRLVARLAAHVALHAPLLLTLERLVLLEHVLVPVAHDLVIGREL